MQFGTEDLSTMSQSSHDLMKIGEGKAIIFLRMMKLHLRMYRETRLGEVCRYWIAEYTTHRLRIANITIANTLTTCSNIQTL
jgi:hypothetical protein